MAPALAPALIGQEAAVCALLGLVLGSVRAVFPVRGRAAFLPDMALVGAVLLGLQSYAAALSAGGVLRWYMPGSAFLCAFGAERLLRPVLRALEQGLFWLAAGPLRLARRALQPLAAARKNGRSRSERAARKKEAQKNRKRTCQAHGGCCIILTYQSKSTGVSGLLSTGGAEKMANTTRKKRRRSPFVRTILRLFFILLLLSMLVAYISNQVSISSRRAELQTLNEQIEQQKTQNEEMKRILSGDADDVTEWVARDSYNYAAPNERIFVDVTGN